MGTYKIGKAPKTWACFVTQPKEGKPSSSAPKTKAAGDNLQPDLAMQKRYKDSGSPALGLMMGDLADKVPKWGKGRCASPGLCKESAVPIADASPTTSHLVWTPPPVSMTSSTSAR
jgi:hypothetical protein